MAKGTQKKTEKATPAASAADIRAGRMRRLAAAIDSVLDNPITVRMHPLWGELSDKERRSVPPTDRRARDLRALTSSEKELRQAQARRKELKGAFGDGRLDLKEDEAVYLETTIAGLPNVWVDAWTHCDNMAEDRRSRMHDLALSLRFRADSGNTNGIPRSAADQSRGGAMTHKLAKSLHLYRELKRVWKKHEPGCTTSKKALAMLVLGTVRGVIERSQKDREILNAVTERDVREWARLDWKLPEASRYKRQTNA